MNEDIDIDIVIDIEKNKNTHNPTLYCQNVKFSVTI